MLASAMGTMRLSQYELSQPEDSIKLQSPLPKETGNAFDDANNNSKGIRLEDSPNSGYQIEYNPETDDYEATKMVGDNAVTPSFSLPSSEYFKLSGYPLFWVV